MYSGTLQNIVNLPFYLQNSGLRQLQDRLRAREQDLEEWKARVRLPLPGPFG